MVRDDEREHDYKLHVVITQCCSQKNSPIWKFIKNNDDNNNNHPLNHLFGKIVKIRIENNPLLGTSGYVLLNDSHC